MTFTEINRTSANEDTSACERNQSSELAEIEIEARHLLSSALFRKKSSLRTLLEFLVERTLTGQGDELNSYTIAVDGLGQSRDFDPQIDSYPRLKVLRLRAALEKFYVSNAPAGARCLYVRRGSYKVRLEPPRLPRTQ